MRVRRGMSASIRQTPRAIVSNRSAPSQANVPPAFEPAKAILIGSILQRCANALIVFPTLSKSACRHLLESEDGMRTSAN